MGSNREQYQSFTPAIDLAAYKTQIKTGVGSPDKACGQNEGSFLACYLMQGLGVRAGSPAKNSAERLAFLAANEKEIAHLVGKHHCQIRFEPNAQLANLFKALVDDVVVYEKLLALNYLTLEVTTGKQETFFHVYFKTANLNQYEKIQEALDMLAQHPVDVGVVDDEKNTYVLLLLKRLKALGFVKDEVTVSVLRSLVDRLITKALVNDLEKGKAVYRALADCYDHYSFFSKYSEAFLAKHHLYQRMEPASKVRMEILNLCLDSFALMGELGFDLATVLYEVEGPYHQGKVAVTGFRFLLHSSGFISPETKRRYYHLLANALDLHNVISAGVSVTYAGSVKIIDGGATYETQLENVVEFSDGEPLIYGLKELPYLFPKDKHGLRLPSVTKLVGVLPAEFMRQALSDVKSSAFQQMIGLSGFLSLVNGDDKKIDYNIIFYFLCLLGGETKDAMTVDGLFALITDEMMGDFNDRYSKHKIKESARKNIKYFFDAWRVMQFFDSDSVFFDDGDSFNMNKGVYSGNNKSFVYNMATLVCKVVHQYARQLIQKARAGEIESEKFSNFLKIVSDEANYIDAKQLYRKFSYTLRVNAFALPALYLKQGERCETIVLDPRQYYQFELAYNPRFGFDKGLSSHDSMVIYSSAKSDDHISVYRSEKNSNILEPLRLTSYRDLTVLRHLHQVGYSFDTPECEQAITEFLTTHDLANPSFYRFMQCLAECGARFPVMVEGKSLTQYVAEKYPTITEAHRKQAVSDYIQQVLSLTEAVSLPGLMEALPPLMGEKVPEEHKVTVQALKAYLVSEEGIKQLAKAQEKALYAFLRGVMSPIRMDDVALRQFLLATQAQMGQRQMNGVDFIKLVDAFLKNLNAPEAEKTLNKVYPVFAPVLVHMASALAETIRLRLHDKVSGEKKEEVKSRVFDSLKVGFRKKLDVKLSGKAKEWLEKMLTSLNALVVSPLPEIIEARLAHLKGYEQLRAELLAIMNPEDKTKSISIESRTIRDAIKAFLLTEGGQASVIAIDDVMAQNISDYLSPDLNQATPSAPPMGEMLEPGITPQTEEAEVDADGYVPPVVPEALPLQLVPGQITNNSMTMYGGREMPAPESVLPVAKQVTMFPEKMYQSAEFASKIAAYEVKIRKRFYNVKSGDVLVDVINKINAHIQETDEIDPLLEPLVCLVTKQVPFYPCGLKDNFGSLDLATLKLNFGQVLQLEGEDETIVADEASVRLFEMQELMFFFTNLQLVARLLNLSAEEQPELRVGLKK